MISATEAATAAYLASTEAAITWAAGRSVAPNIRPISEFGGGALWQPTYVFAASQSTADTVKALQSPLVEKTKADASVSQLLKFACLPNDWDGYGAAKPNHGSLNAARSFIRSLAPESIVPQPALHADGNVILFYRNDDVYVELEFVGNNVDFFARQEDKEWASEFQIGTPLPPALSEIGFSM